MQRTVFCLVLSGLLNLSLSHAGMAEELAIPRRHDRPPGPPITAEQAAAKMTVPEGFTVEVVAAEPDVMNPVAMCIDERGRFWVTESFEYPRKAPGPGKDRIKILEDTTGDGKVDKVTVFAEGLNIPSGIAVGYGGVWVCNSPDLLFMQDTNGDGKADKTEVVVTGFGRTDTHELPNSLTWGPDGWLYGLNGVFNYSKVKYAKTNPNYTPEHPGWNFTCAMFRVHPRTREFQIFAEGTSNPWGIAMNGEGEFFISACVIDHLWHIVQTGYYIRQGGPYPPHTWPMRSIVDHKHQKAAYCGITWFDSDAYPPEYSNVLYMGNIHGGCINADIADRSGSTYKATPHPGFPPKPGAWDDDEYGLIAKTGDPENPKLADFLTANDAWFMPVVQKVGPDGCLYVLDWYDRYHCYQDANADPKGVDRGKGRLYRVRYKNTPHSKPFDLNQKSDDELIALLGSPNVYYRDAAQRLLGERNSPETAKKLLMLILDDKQPRIKRLTSMYAAAGIEGQQVQLANIAGAVQDPVFQGWATRFAFASPEIRAKMEQLGSLPKDKANGQEVPIEVSLQMVIGSSRLQDQKLASTVLLSMLRHPQCDSHLQHLIWMNLTPRILADPEAFVALLLEDEQRFNGSQKLLPRMLTLHCRSTQLDGKSLRKILLRSIINPEIDKNIQTVCLNQVVESAQSRSLSGKRLDQLVAGLSTYEAKVDDSQKFGLTMLRALAGDADALKLLRTRLEDSTATSSVRLSALNALITAGDANVLASAAQILSAKNSESRFLASIIDAVSKINDPRVADVLLENFSRFQPDIQPKAIEVLTQRPGWSLALLKEIKAGKIEKNQVNFNQLKRMATFKKNEPLQQLLTATYGQIRNESRVERRHLINRQKDFLRGTPGDPVAGAAMFKKVCAQCHKIYGQGAEVGPDITRNGRNNWDQLLQNVFDPSAVIGPGYQARMIATTDGRVLTGLPVEDSPERVVLKIQGGKLEVIPKDQIEQDKLSKLSLMPENVEKLMTPQELADLFAFLSLDKPPTDPQARILSGAPAQKQR